MKRFVAIKGIVLLIFSFIIPEIIIAILLLCLVEPCEWRNYGIVICLIAVICTIIELFYLKLSSSIVITETVIKNDFSDGTRNEGWIEEISEIQSYKITDCKEGQKYYKNCKAKKILLIDFGNGNVKYIAMSWFTKKQIEKILATIEERRKALQNRTSE